MTDILNTLTREGNEVMITDEMIEKRREELRDAILNRGRDIDPWTFIARRELEREAPELTEERVSELAISAARVWLGSQGIGNKDWKAVVRHMAAALRAGAEPPAKPDPVEVAMKAYDKAVREGCNPRMGSVEVAIRVGIAADREAR